MNDLMIYSGIIIPVITLISILFAIGKSNGRQETILSNVHELMREHKENFKIHVIQDTENFKDLSENISDLKVVIAKKR